jgi:hypothetical protein
MNRMKRGDMSEVQQPPVNEETANKMSLFFAYPNPFTKALIDEFEKVNTVASYLFVLCRVVLCCVVLFSLFSLFGLFRFVCFNQLYVQVEPRDHLMRCFALVANACREMSER